MDGLRVGVIGLGRHWTDSYLPALVRQRGRFTVSAVFDAVPSRCSREARRLGCAATVGPAELLERTDVEALLLLETDWHGLWPLERAVQLGKPVLCRPGLEQDEPHANRLLQTIRGKGVPVLFTRPARLVPVVGQLRDLLDNRLGPARIVLGTCLVPRMEPGEPKVNQKDGTWVDLLDLSALLLGTPQAILAVAARNDSHSAVLIEFADGRLAQLTRCQARQGSFRLRVEVVGERGRAVAELPARLAWTDEAGSHRLTLRGSPPVASALLERFTEAIAGCAAADMDLENAVRLLAWVQGIRRSRQQGRWIELKGEE